MKSRCSKGQGRCAMVAKDSRVFGEKQTRKPLYSLTRYNSSHKAQRLLIKFLSLHPSYLLVLLQQQ